jgi:hypothetical protein
MKRKQQKGRGLLNFFRRTQRQPAPARPLPATVPAAQPNTRSGFRKFLNRFTRKQPTRVAPLQEPTTRRGAAPSFSQRQRKYETLYQSLRRIMVFFFKKHFPAEAGRYPDTAISLSAEDHLRLVREFRDFYFSLPNDLNMDNKLQRIATDFFNAPSLADFDREIAVEEIGEPGQRKIFNQGTPNERISFTSCGNLSRCLNNLLSFPRELQYIGNVNAYYSTIPAENKPITTLQSEKPIDVFKNIERVEQILRNSIYPVNSYIVIKPQFYRNPGRIPLKANKFIQTSFIEDAFEQEGVLLIDPQLFAVLQEEAPQFLQKAEIKLATPDQLDNLEIVGGKFMIFEEDALRYRRTYLYPAAIPEIREAMENRQVLLTDPLTMYILRKDDPELWTACFDDVNMNAYKKLTGIEQLAFCFLQYIQIYKRYRQNLSRMPPEDAIRAAIHLFSLPIHTRDLLPKYMENFQNTNSAEWTSLQALSEKITNRSVNINDIEDLQALFAKMLEEEISFQALPSATSEQLNIEGLQNQLERLNTTLRKLVAQRNAAPPNSRQRRVASQLIKESMNTRRTLQRLIQFRQNNTPAFGRNNLRSTRRRLRS